MGSIYRLFNTGGAGRSDGRGHIPFSHLQCERIARGISRGAVAASRPAHGARDLQLKCNDFLAARVGESECVCVRARVRMYEWTRRHACMHACVHACVCMHVFMHVFICV